jgi:putative iron-only hydrogenase system regulator
MSRFLERHCLKKTGFFIFSTIERMSMEKRLGFVGIIIENRKKGAPMVNALLTEYGDLIVARTGIPYQRRKCCVITLVVDATTDELGALTGKLGKVDGVAVKAALAKEREK